MSNATAEKEDNVSNATAEKKASKRRSDFYYLENPDRVYVSVTTFLKIIDKSGPLMWWAQGLMFDAICKDPSLLSDRKACMSIPRTKLEKAGATGSMIHSWIEAIKKGAKLDPTTLPEESRGYGEAFIKWQQQVQPEFLLHELTVWSDQYKYAGTLDAVAKINGEIVVVDFKTAKHLYPENALQLCAYRIAFNEMKINQEDGDPFPQPDGELLVHLKPDGNFEGRTVQGEFSSVLSAKHLWEWRESQKDF